MSRFINAELDLDSDSDSDSDNYSDDDSDDDPNKWLQIITNDSHKKNFIIGRKFFFIVAGKIKKYKCPGLLQTNKIFHSCEIFFL